MNLANKITICRLLLVPVFAALVLNYKELPGGEREFLRHLAFLIFVLAALSDAVDGFIARAFKQQTRLGSILDPLADKLLLVTAVVLLSLNIPGLDQLPIYFPVLVISRDLFLIVGSLMVHLTTGHLRVVPNLFGKATTVFQMATVIWVLLKWPHPEWAWIPAALLTFCSGMVYIIWGSKQLNGNQAFPAQSA